MSKLSVVTLAVAGVLVVALPAFAQNGMPAAAPADAAQQQQEVQQLRDKVTADRQQLKLDRAALAQAERQGNKSVHHASAHRAHHAPAKGAPAAVEKAPLAPAQEQPAMPVQ